MSMIQIRSARPEDAAAIRDIYSYYVEHTAISFEWETPSVSELQRRMARTMERYPYLVAEQDGAVLGYAYAGPFVGRIAYDWSCEMTIYLAHGARRRGLGRMLYEAMEQALGSMGILNLYACIGYPEQEDEYLTRNSADFHRHMGYELVGRFRRCGYKFDRWYDMIWMEKIIGTHGSPQPPVTSFNPDKLCGTP